MNKYSKLVESLDATGMGEMTVFGNSMEPKLKSGCTNTYKVCEEYKVGDIVLAKVQGRFIDAHLISKIGKDGQYMIANNHGHENGWSRKVYAKVVKSRNKDGTEKTFD